MGPRARPREVSGKEGYHPQAKTKRPRTPPEDPGTQRQGYPPQKNKNQFWEAYSNRDTTHEPNKCALGPPQDPGKPQTSSGIDPRRGRGGGGATRGGLPDPTVGEAYSNQPPAVGDHPGLFPLSLRLRPKAPSVQIHLCTWFLVHWVVCWGF